MRNLHYLVLITSMSLSCLACGGLGGGSAAAGRLCEHLAGEEDAPCVAVGSGSTATIDGFEVTVDEVTTWTGTHALGRTKYNAREMDRFKAADDHALVVEATYTNTEPVKAKAAFYAQLVDGDGNKIDHQYYNGRDYREAKDDDDWILLWDDNAVGPNKSRPVALVFAVPEKLVEGSLLIFRKSEERPDPEDPRGRKKQFTDELVVMDLDLPD